MTSRRATAKRCHKCSKQFLLQLLAVASIAGPQECNAFQPEFLSVAEALQVAASLPDYPAIAIESAGRPLDEFLFAAANLVDNRPKRPPLLLPSRRSISPYVRFPEIYQSASIQYDYETQPITRTIQLTPAEQQLFELMRKVRNQYSPSTTIRVAGGWVRDKLLYGSADDIDFVLSDISGKDFAPLVCRYLEEVQGQDTCSVPPAAELKTNKGVQSEHLQTASLSVLGFEVDFCRFRTERYQRNSRIPQATGVASVVEDAWRRDLTINSLFYNINTNQVEDWTEQGLQDLQLRNINTPKAPLPTLLEDPTRILRAIRFAAQLSFGMDKRLVQAARDARVKFGLETKVSRDAIGNEIDSLFSTRDPTRGIKLLMETNLINVALPLYDGLDEELPVASEQDPFTPAIYYTGLDLLARTQALVSRVFTTAPQWDADKRRYLWYSAFLRPIYGTSSASLSALTSKRGKRDGSGFYRLLATGLKRTKADMQAIENILKGVEVLGSLLAALDDEAVKDVVRCDSNSRFRDISREEDVEKWQKLSDLRWLWFKAIKPIGPLWKEALILAIASSRTGLSESVDQYKEWINFIENRIELDTENTKPLLDGGQIKRVLPGVSGKGFKDILSVQEEWMIRNCADLKESDEERSVAASQLNDYLVRAFPEYAVSPLETTAR